MTTTHAPTREAVEPPRPLDAPPSEGRRSVARALAAVAAAFTALLLLPRSLARAAEPAEEDEPPPPREGDFKRLWGMAIDLDLCTACGACSVACKTENNVPSLGPGEQFDGARLEWLALLPAEKGDEAFGVAGATLPLPCLHCEEPPCVKVCPVGATYQTEEGITAQIWDRCIGCRYCMVACPYSRRYFNWTQAEWPESYRSFLNPAVATRPAGVVEKCTFCHQRVRDVREAARVAGEVLTDEAFRKLPACAACCPADAIVFGDLSDERSRVAALARSPRAFRLLDELGTKPKVFYLGRDRREVSS
jgi:molybdopterin-containing oxidoreductase family iron-sulfur binding subunit